MQRASAGVVDAVPHGGELVAVLVHGKGAVQRGQYHRGVSEIRAWQGLSSESGEDRDRQQRRAHAVSTHIQQVKRQAVLIEPVMAEQVAAES